MMMQCDHADNHYVADVILQGKCWHRYRCATCGETILSAVAPVNGRLNVTAPVTCDHPEPQFVGIEDRQGRCGKMRPHQIWKCTCGAEWTAPTNRKN